MKFLLIIPGHQLKDNKSNINSSIILPPLGLLYIGATLEQDDHKVDLYDYYVEKFSKEKLKNSLMSSDAVGMMVYTDHYTTAGDICRLIKEIDADMPLIIGGPHCSLVKEQSLKDIPNADISVLGEGDKVILGIARYLEGKKNISDIQGIYYRDNESIQSGRPIQVIDNLDSRPFPARHLVDKYDYSAFPFRCTLKKRVTSLITSIGCPFNCRFCNKIGNFLNDRGYRKRSAENVVDEIKELDGKYKSVIIIDDNFLVDKKRTHKMLDMIIESDINIDFYITGARVDIANKELYLKMKKAGVKYIFYGLESGNQDVLNLYNKKITIQQIRNTIELAREMDFFIDASFIFGAPIETKKHIENTIKFACSLPLDSVNFAPLIYRIGSSLWDGAVKNKKISPNQYEIPSDSKYNLGNFTNEELIEFSTKAFRTFYFRPNFILRQIFRAILRNDYSFFVNGLKYFISFNKTIEVGKEVVTSKKIN